MLTRYWYFSAYTPGQIPRAHAVPLCYLPVCLGQPVHVRFNIDPPGLYQRHSSDKPLEFIQCAGIAF